MHIKPQRESISYFLEWLQHKQSYIAMLVNMESLEPPHIADGRRADCQEHRQCLSREAAPTSSPQCQNPINFSPGFSYS